MSSKSSFREGVKNVKNKILPGRAYDDGHTKRTSAQDPLNHLPIKRLSKLTPEDLQSYSSEQLERLENDRLSVLPGETLSRLSPRRLAQLPVKAFEKLNPEALVQLPAGVLAKLENHFLANTSPDVLFCALPALHSDDLLELKNAIHRIGHERLRRLPSDVKRRLPIPVDYDAVHVPPPESPPLLIQNHDISIHSLNTGTFQGLPAMQQSTQDFGMPSGYLESHHEQQQQPGVAGFNAYNPAGIDPSAFPDASPPSPTNTYAGRSSTGAVKSLASCQSTGYHPPKTSDYRPPHGPRRNSSVSKGSHTRARSSSRGPKQDREYQAYNPVQVTYAAPGPIQYGDVPRDISETPLGHPTPPIRSSSCIDSRNLSPSEVLRHLSEDTWKEEHREIPRKETPRKETPKASRESIIIIKEDSLSSTSSSPKSSPEVASFAERERKRAATSLGHHATSSPTLNALDDAESDHTNQAIQNHTIKELRAENVRLRDQLVDAKSDHKSHLRRLTKYIDDKCPGKNYKGDAIDAIIAYSQEILDANTSSFNASKHWQSAYESEKKHRQELDMKLDDKSGELRAADDKLQRLQREVREYREHNTELQTQASSLRNEISRLERANSALEGSLEKEKRQLEKQKAQSDTAITTLKREHENNVSQLRQTLAARESELKSQNEKHAQEILKQRLYYEDQFKSLNQKLSDKDQEHETYIANLVAQHQQETTTLNSAHQQKLQEFETGCNEQITSLQASHTQQLANMQKKHDQEIQRLNKRHARNVVDLREKVQSLENDLVGNNDDFRPATDDSLKIQYRQLKLCIDMVTEPINLGINGVPRNVSKIDGTRFLEREGKNQLRFLLRSVVWQRIVEGFFSEPFGMGALGPKGKGGGGWEVLRGVVEGWRGLCGYSSDGMLTNGKGSKSATDNDLLAPFFYSREANKWRSATFQSILMAVAPPSSSISGNKANARKAQQQAPSPSGTPGPPEHPTTTPYWANINQVQTQIVALLSSICSEPLSPEIQSKVSELARQAGELALQFGAQRAQLALEVPKRGEQVKIGTESGWVDCEDGDSFGGRRGVEVEVDLCVSPKVYRVGDMDGRNMDRKTAKVKAIVAGEVYPRRS